MSTPAARQEPCRRTGCGKLYQMDLVKNPDRWCPACLVDCWNFGSDEYDRVRDKQARYGSPGLNKADYARRG